MKLSLHRALAELRQLEKRIYASINESKYITYQNGEEKPRGFSDKEDFIKHATDGYQSANDLINRRNEIKSKLILANVTTEIKVGDTVMTIAEAIDQKEAIQYKQSLLTELKRQFSVVNQLVEKDTVDMESRLDKRLDADMGQRDRKNFAKEVEEITEHFVKRYRPVLIDPLSIREEILKLEKELNDFYVKIGIRSGSSMGEYSR